MIYSNRFRYLHPIKHYIAQKDGKVVASASLFIENGVAGFYNLCVLPDYRHLGFGTAMKWQRLLDSQKLGAKLAILQSSDLGLPLDKKIGFVPTMSYTPYILLPKH